MPVLRGIQVWAGWVIRRERLVEKGGKIKRSVCEGLEWDRRSLAPTAT